MRYMFDTNICIYLMKYGSAKVVARLSALSQGDVVMSVVSYGELRAGLEMRSTNRVHDEWVLGLLISQVPVVAFDEDAAKAYGVLRAAVSSRRRDALDRLIGAHAISLGVTLVTNNEADFVGYPNLSVENWMT